MEPLDPSDTEKYAILFYIEEAYREAVLQDLQLLRPGKESITVKPANGFRFTPGMPPDTVSAIMDHGRFIKRLLKVWDAHPNLRFGQLLMNVFCKSMTTGNTLDTPTVRVTNIAQKSDEELFKEIEKFYADRDNPDESK